MYITRKYAGEFLNQVQIDKRSSRIYTTETTFVVLSPHVDIQDSCKCYIQNRSQRLIGTLDNVYIAYFIWEGSTDEILIKQNIYTGEFLK